MIAKTRLDSRAVAYYRMSSDKQEASIPAQREAVQRFAAEHGYRIQQEYIDEGISGDATDKRLGFQRMIMDSERAGFGAILCWDIDRFGRFDSIEAGHWIYPLRRAGIHLATVAQGVIDWSDFTGRVMYSIQQEAKNQYLTDLSRNVTRGMMRMAEQGLWASGQPPIGYALQDKRLVLGSESDVTFVRRIFRDYLNGASLRGLCEILNSEGVLSPKKKTWCANGLASLLHNRTYVGDFIWNQRCMSKYKRKGRKAKVNPMADWVVIENHHEPIIDRATFDAAQAQLAARKHQSTPHRRCGGFMLSGVLVCGKCGHKMNGDLYNGIHHYTCYGYRQRGKAYCDRNSLKQKTILDAVLDAIQASYYNPETLERLAVAIRAELKKRDHKPNVDRVRAELTEVEAKLIKAKRRLVEVDADLLDVVQEQVRSLREQETRLKGLMKPAASRRDSGAESVDAKVRACLGWFGKLKDAAERSDPQLVRQFIRESVTRIEIWPDKVPWTAKRFKYRLGRGCVTLKGDNLLSMPR